MADIKTVAVTNLGACVAAAPAGRAQIEEDSNRSFYAFSSLAGEPR
jgi:hypothetical protein